jgi:hypothetical protein
MPSPTEIPANLTKSDTASALIGTKIPPSGLKSILANAHKARAYHQLNPYPVFAFRSWRTEDRGPLPTCMPFSRSIVERGATWLFGKPLQIKVPGNTALEEFLRKAWRTNKMDSRLVALARKAGQDGQIALKFSYDDTNEDNPLAIQDLSIDECRFFYDPHDTDRVLMVRIQYQFQDPLSGKTLVYREEHTDQLYVEYAPIEVALMGHGFDPDTSDDWIELSRSPNPFGKIPVILIKNFETDDVFGAGDLWDLFVVIDRINLTMNLADRGNQFDSQANPVWIDLELDEQDIDKPLQPGQPISAATRADAPSRGSVEVLESSGGLRSAMMEYVEALKKEVLAACSSVDIDESDVTNKGAITQAVLAQLYLPQIQINDEKRKSWGTNGLEPFLALVARGLQKAGVKLGVNEKDEDTYTVTVKFADYFELSQDERLALVGRMEQEVAAGFMTTERAIEIIAAAEGIDDINALKEEIAKEQAAKAAALAAEAALATTVQDNATTTALKSAAGPDAK